MSCRLALSLAAALALAAPAPAVAQDFFGSLLGGAIGGFAGATFGQQQQYYRPHRRVIIQQPVVVQPQPYVVQPQPYVVQQPMVVQQPVYQQGYAYDPAVLACAQRFRSYNMATQTFTGYDGFQHRCPR